MTFDYEDHGLRLHQEKVNGGHAVDYAYDDDDLLTQAGALDLTPHASHGLLAATELDDVATAYTYNAFGELDEDVATLAGSPPTTLYRNQYTQRDKLGRIRQKVETIDGTMVTWDYAYDPAGRVDTVDRTPSGGSAARLADYAYDVNGNRLCTDATGGTCPGTQAVYDAQDRLVTDEAGRSYTYTEAGELARVDDGSLASAYAYDALGNLRASCIDSTDPEDDCENGTAIEYLIDGFGRRVGKKVGGTLQQGFLWSDGLRLVAELDGSGAVVSRFVYANRLNVPEYMVKEGSTYRILTDHLGSVRVVVNADTGVVAQRIDYDAWGVPTFTGPADFQPFGFAGGLYDPLTGLVRFGARDYDATTARWTSKDRLRFAARDTNLYRYAFSDPVNVADPSGLWVPLVGGAIGGFVGGWAAYNTPNATVGSVLVGIGGGAFFGALSTLTFGLGPLAGGAVAGAGAGLFGNFAGQFGGHLASGAGASCFTPDLPSLANATLAGGVGGVVGAAFGPVGASPAAQAGVAAATAAYYEAASGYFRTLPPIVLLPAI